jgi:multisubunit Na+/H+ antiporter MnhE subunit
MGVGSVRCVLPPPIHIRLEVGMLMTLVIVLAALWLLGVATSYTMGGLIHVLLVAAVTIMLLRMFRDRRPTSG